MDVKAFVKTKGLGLWFAAASIVLVAIAVILSCIVTANDGSMDVAVLVLSIIAVAGSAVTLFFDYNGFGRIAVALLQFCCLGLLVASQLGNIGYAAAGIHDIGNGIQPGFIVAAVFYLIATALTCATVFFKDKKTN